MYPTAEVPGSVELPADATYWMPKRSEVGDEGIGFFRDVWTIIDVPLRDARELIALERRLATAVSEAAETAQDFDRLARIVELGLDDDDDADIAPAERASLEPVLYDMPPLDSLELGVAGLVLALGAVGMIPAASCRGHCTGRAWSPRPVVYVATTQYRAQALADLIGPTGCRFGIDTARPDFLVVAGRSIEDTMNLADAVLAARQSFVQARSERSGGRWLPAPQEPLF
jgi:hypothetical protein